MSLPLSLFVSLSKPSHGALSALSAALISTFACNAQAQNAALTELPAVVVTASRLPQTLTDTIANTTLITREDIERSGAVDAPTLLSSYAGIQFGRNGGVGQSANIFMRGTSPRNTLVLIDGVPVNDQNDGTARIELLPLDLIDRIEVVRGNVSAQYGSSAVGGVIQIFTRSATRSSANLSVELGTQGHRKLAASASLLAGNTALFASASRSTIKGVSAENPKQSPYANPDADGSRQTTGSLGLDHTFSSDLKMGFKVLSTQQRAQYDDDYNGTLTSDDTIRQRMNQYSGYLNWQVNSIWQSQVKLSRQSQTARSDANNAPVNTNENHKQFVSWQNNLNAGSLGTVLLAIENEKHDFKGESFGAFGYATPSHTRSNTALLAGWQGKMAGLGWNANTRNDKSDGKAVNTYGLGASYDLNAQWSVLASTANAFNRATLGQTYDPYYGNSALSAERAKNQELGVQWAKSNNLVKLTHHRSRTDNMFGFDPNTFQTINIGEVRNKGFELLAELAMPWSGGKLRLNANTQNPVNQADMSRLARRAKKQLSWGLQGKVGAWSWDANGTFMGNRTDKYFDPSTYASSPKTLGSYTKLDASLAYAINPQATVGLYLNNITKVNDQTAYGYSATPRGAVLRVNYKL